MMAYLNSRLKEAIYMKPPEGSGVAPRQVYKVVKGLYGLKQSGQEWNQEFNRSLRCMEFFQVECTPCIYTKGQGKDMAIVVIYIDDTLVIAPQLETVLKVKKQIGQRWKMEDSGEVSHFLGIKISQNRVMHTMTIGQSGYIDQVLAKHLDKCTKPTMVPMQSIPEGTLVASAAQQKEYLVIIGKLLWVANSTRPDLSLTVGILAKHMHEPSFPLTLVSRAPEWCHGPGCSRSRRVTGSYGRSTGIEDLVDTSREHGRSAVSMETMDSYGLTCKGEPSHMRGGPGTATRRTKLKEQAQPRRGPSSDGYHSGARETRVIGHWQAGHEEEEQCRRSRHQVMRRRSSVEGVDTTQEAQGCQTGEAPEQYSMKKVLSGERAGAALLAML
ncbi:hypothetical protein NDA14_002434 [Ustilago hordei]|nr:hypothetical protein NDA14_002434 [Ustilago hordei]